MINKVSMQLVSELGDALPVKDANANLESLLEITTAELFSEICKRNNDTQDDEVRLDEKFRFALNLREFKIDLEVF